MAALQGRLTVPITREGGYSTLMSYARCLGRGFHLVLFLSIAGFSGVAAQTRNVTGHVTEEGSELPVPSAQVLVKGSAIGTVAGDDGAFSLRVPEGEVVLQVRRIGYQRAEVTVPATQSTVEIRVRKDVLQLDQMVVTGQATGIEKRNLANAVAVVNADELNKVQSQSFESALQGKVAGANISANNGAPGGGIQLQLRGTTSIIGNSD